MLFWIALRHLLRHAAIRLGAGSSAAVLIAWPLWAASQDYLFLFSILPGLWPWLGAASGLLGLSLAVTAVVPRRKTNYELALRSIDDS